MSRFRTVSDSSVVRAPHKLPEGGSGGGLSEETAMTNTKHASGMEWIDRDAISRGGPVVKIRAVRGSAMTRAEAVTLDRKRQRLKDAYMLLLLGLDERSSKLKEDFSNTRVGDVGSQGMMDRPGLYLFRRCRKLAAGIQLDSWFRKDHEFFKAELRLLAWRYNAMVKAGILHNRTLRNDIRAILVDMARQIRRADRNQPENGP